MNRRVSALNLFFLLAITTSYSQQNFKSRTSPLAMVSMRFKDAYVKVTYSQPHKRGREIFGQLVPYNEVWRLGANEATEITLTKDMMIANHILKAGTYSLFSIPQSDKWTIIVNSDLGLWGAYNYNIKADIIRFDVPVQPNNEFFEAFTLSFDQRNEMADLLIMWDRIKLSVPFKFLN